MATKESKRVMAQRRRDYDRISFVVDKEAKHLIRAQALREGVSSAEMIRRAILARCGLEHAPDYSSKKYKAIVSASDKESAISAIEGLQLDEYMKQHEHDQKQDNNLHPATRLTPVLPQDNLRDLRLATRFLTLALASQNMRDEYVKALLDLLDAVEDATAPQIVDGMTITPPPTRINFDEKSLAIVRRLLSNIDVVNEYDDDDI
jgi:hypothetical protein